MPDAARQFLLFEPAAAATITALEVARNDPMRRYVRVDGKRIATVSQTVIDQLGLAEGDSWDDATADALDRALALDAARKIAFRTLGRAGMSSTQLAARLERKGIESDIAAAIVEEFEADGWLDDQTFAMDIVRSALEGGPAGDDFLRARLEKRGVTGAAADSAIDAALAETDLRTRTIEFATKRLRTMTAASPATKMRRLAGAMARRGLDEDLIHDVLRELDLAPEPPLADGME